MSRLIWTTRLGCADCRVCVRSCCVFGHLPPLYPEVHSRQRGDVGIISFNVFLVEPVLAEIKRAIDGFRVRGAKALIFDVRGNPGGQAAIAIPIVARLVSAQLELGTVQFRDFAPPPQDTPVEHWVPPAAAAPESDEPAARAPRPESAAVPPWATRPRH